MFAPCSGGAAVAAAADPGGGPVIKLYEFHGQKFAVDARYDCTRMLGHGAYGMVVSAVDTSNGEKVAIKKIRSVFEDLVDGKRILREVKLLGFLRHQNLLRLKDMMRPSDPENFSDIYMVTDFMETDLHNIIRSRQRLVDEQIRYFLYQLCCGLHYIHSAGVLHRDLKPSNLLVNTQCDLKICDFGLARGVGDSMTDYVVTRWYRPPELLLLCDRYGPGVDMWGVGCMAVELLTRRPLFAGRDYVHQLNLITDVLGTPSDEDLALVKSDSARRYVQSLPRKSPMPLGTVAVGALPAYIAFVEGLLLMDPRRRLSARDAMRHELFRELYDPSDEQCAPFPFKWELDDVDITEPQLRQGMWAEVVKYRPK